MIAHLYDDALPLCSFWPMTVGKSAAFNYPPLVDVFREAHRRGGIGGPAHGGGLAKSSTALVDTVRGEVRTYVCVGNGCGFDAWADALERGQVFVTSGPLIRFTVNEMPAGSVIRLPAQGGEVEVSTELSSPRELESLEVVRMGKPILESVQKSRTDGIDT